MTADYSREAAMTPAAAETVGTLAQCSRSMTARTWSVMMAASIA